MDHREVLPRHTVLDGKYRIERVLGVGGFGITYEATDIGLGMSVAIKEYYPAELALRDQTRSIRPRSDKQRHLFEHLRSSFLREAQTLAQFDDPSIVRVISVFPAHGTAYMVMRYEVGLSVKAWLAKAGRPPTQEEVDRILANLLRALELMHARNFLHRDIATDNIILRPSGDPVLLDFGSSRRVIAEATGALTGIVKQGFSPPEQYSAEGRAQGPWTDIYAMGATLYRCVTGNMPPEGTVRTLDDEYVSCTEAAQADYRREFLEAIDWSLAVFPKDRPQSIAEWRPALFAGTPLERSVFIDPAFADREGAGAGYDDGGSGEAISRPGARSAPSRPSRGSRPPSSTPRSTGSRPRSEGPNAVPPPVADDVPVAAEPVQAVQRPRRKLAYVAALAALLAPVGAMMLLGLTLDDATRRVGALVTSLRGAEQAATVRSTPAPAATSQSVATRQAEEERQRAETERQRLAEAKRQQEFAALAERQRADVERQRIEAESRQRAEEARLRQQQAAAETERKRIEAERLRQAEEARRSAEAERQRQAEQQAAEQRRRSATLTATQSGELLRELQILLSEHNCYLGQPNASESDVLQGLENLRRFDAGGPSIALAKATMGEAEDALDWLDKRPRPICPGPSLEERRLEEERVERERVERERAQQQKQEEALRARELERQRDAEQARLREQERAQDEKARQQEAARQRAQEEKARQQEAARQRAQEDKARQQEEARQRERQQAAQEERNRQREAAASAQRSRERAASRGDGGGGGGGSGSRGGGGGGGGVSVRVPSF